MVLQYNYMLTYYTCALRSKQLYGVCTGIDWDHYIPSFMYKYAHMHRPELTFFLVYR